MSGNRGRRPSVAMLGLRLTQSDSFSGGGASKDAEKGALVISHMVNVPRVCTFEEALRWVIDSNDVVSAEALLHVYRQFSPVAETLSLVERIHAEAASRGDSRLEDGCSSFLMRWVGSCLVWDFHGSENGAAVSQVMQLSQKVVRPEDRTKMQLFFLNPPAAPSFDLNMVRFPSAAAPSPNSAFLEWSAKVVASHLTLIDYEIFLAVHPAEFHALAWQQEDKERRAPHLSLLANRFNELSKWVAATVLCTPPPTRPSSTISKWIKVMHELLKQHNFQSLMAILAGLNHGAVQRLKSSWDDLSPKQHEAFQEFESLMSPMSGFKNYANAVEALDDDDTVVPYVGAYLGRVAMMLASNKIVDEHGKIVFATFNVVGRCIADCLRLRRHARYALKTDNETLLFFISLRLSLSEDDMYAISMSLEANRAGTALSPTSSPSKDKKKRRFSFAARGKRSPKIDKSLLRRKAAQSMQRMSASNISVHSEALISPRHAEEDTDSSEMSREQRRRDLVTSQRVIDRKVQRENFEEHLRQRAKQERERRSNMDFYGTFPPRRKRHTSRTAIMLFGPNSQRNSPRMSGNYSMLAGQLTPEDSSGSAPTSPRPQDDMFNSDVRAVLGQAVRRLSSNHINLDSSPDDSSSESSSTASSGPASARSRPGSNKGSRRRVKKKKRSVRGRSARPSRPSSEKLDVPMVVPPHEVPRKPRKPSGGKRTSARKGHPKVKKTPRATMDQNPHEWNDADVRAWLERSGLPFLAPAFRENDIQGADLFELTPDDLRDLGINNKIHEKMFKQAIENLRVQERLEEIEVEEPHAGPIWFVVVGAGGEKRVLKADAGVDWKGFEALYGSALSKQNLVHVSRDGKETHCVPSTFESICRQVRKGRVRLQVRE